MKTPKQMRQQRLVWLLRCVKGFNAFFRPHYFECQMKQDFKENQTVFICQSLKDLVHTLQLQLEKELKSK